MAWVIMLIMYLVVAGSGVNMSSAEGTFLYFERLHGFYQGLLPIAGVLVLIGIFILALSLIRGGELSLSCGCFMTAIPLFFGIVIAFHTLLTGLMLSSFDPQQGLVDPVKFIIAIILHVGTGVSA